jgi:hypothetical protein
MPPVAEGYAFGTREIITATDIDMGVAFSPDGQLLATAVATIRRGYGRCLAAARWHE